MGEFFQAAIKAVAVLITAVINFAQAPTEELVVQKASAPIAVASSQTKAEPVSAMVDSVRKIAEATLSADPIPATAVAQNTRKNRAEIRRKIIVIVPAQPEAPRVIGEDLIDAEVRGRVIAVIADELPAETREELFGLLKPMN